jgi:hypothetical protein
LLLPYTPIHILDSLYRNSLLLQYLVEDGSWHHTAADSDLRQFALESLFAAGFDPDPGRHIEARNEFVVYAVCKQEIPFDNFDRFGAGIPDDDLKQIGAVGASLI